jgi:hypothetical protein
MLGTATDMTAQRICGGQPSAVFDGFIHDLRREHLVDKLPDRIKPLYIRRWGKHARGLAQITDTGKDRQQKGGAMKRVRDTR